MCKIVEIKEMIMPWLLSSEIHSVFQKDIQGKKKKTKKKNPAFFILEIQTS